ncbi:MAG: capsule assembly Wzi family protein, partial [bacterium]|nr:capsule assembly Wzi family protein [bacterium]
YGKFSNFWGPGRTGSLILSDYATSYDQLKLEFIFNRFKFTSSYAFLIDYQDQEEDILQGKKYLAAHRLEFLPWRWLSIGMSETVMFKGRNFEPAYLNPIMFFRSAEHYLGSPDNMMLGMDFKLVAIKNFKFYGELLIDDITTTKLGTDWYGNKLGYQVGSLWLDPFKMKNTGVRIEYTRIGPYVYSHKNSLSYKHYDSLLGHSIGPNADALYLEMNYQLSKWTRMILFGEFYRHGANFADRNVGGDENLPHRFGDDLNALFLDGIVEKRNSLGCQFSYEIFRDFYLRLNYDWANTTNVNLKPDEQRNSRSHRFAVSIGLNY